MHVNRNRCLGIWGIILFYHPIHFTQLLLLRLRVFCDWSSYWFQSLKFLAALLFLATVFTAQAAVWSGWGKGGDWCLWCPAWCHRLCSVQQPQLPQTLPLLQMPNSWPPQKQVCGFCFQYTFYCPILQHHFFPVSCVHTFILLQNWCCTPLSENHPKGDASGMITYSSLGLWN